MCVKYRQQDRDIYIYIDICIYNKTKDKKTQDMDAYIYMVVVKDVYKVEKTGRQEKGV
jgi:hypothetical protein